MLTQVTQCTNYIACDCKLRAASVGCLSSGELSPPPPLGLTRAYPLDVNTLHAQHNQRADWLQSAHTRNAHCDHNIRRVFKACDPLAFSAAPPGHLVTATNGERLEATARFSRHTALIAKLSLELSALVAHSVLPTETSSAPEWSNLPGALQVSKGSSKWRHGQHTTCKAPLHLNQTTTRLPSPPTPSYLLALHPLSCHSLTSSMCGLRTLGVGSNKSPFLNPRRWRVCWGVA